MSPAPETAKITIRSAYDADPLEIDLSASGRHGPTRVQWRAPRGIFIVRFPAGVFEGGTVKQIIEGDTWQPERPLQLLPEANPNQYTNYIEEVMPKRQVTVTKEVTVTREVMFEPMAGTPIIIVKK